MAMGTTSRVALNDEMQKAKAECSSYRSTIASLLSELDSTINNLLSSGFQGEAANGFLEFYKKNITAFFETDSTFDQFLGMFDKDEDGLFDCIEKSLTVGEGVDPSLGDNNKSIGSSSEG